MGWRRAVTLLAVAAAMLAAPSARAAQLLVMDGAGDGHGVGMSQTGAEGLALHGYSATAILAHYYTGTSLGRISPGREETVLLQSGLTGAVFSGATRAGTRPLNAASIYIADPGAGGTVLLRGEHGHLLARLSAPLQISGATPLTLDGMAVNGITDGHYRGRLEVLPHGRRLDVINLVGIESYLRGVVPAESPPTWSAAELRAQAIAARTYAVASAPVGEFDLYGDVRSQQYDGVVAETAATDAAVAQTADQIVTYAGKPIVAYYFASSGGETEDVQDAFAGVAPEPYLQAVADPFDATRFGPDTLTLKAAAAKLRGLLEGSLKAIVVTRRGVSPRIVTAELVGSAGTTSVSGATLENALDLPSTWACFTITPQSGVPKSGWDAACRRRITPGGTTGATGVTGVTGPSGASGLSGASGTTGSSGGGTLAPTGASGTTIATGASGLTGASGDTSGGVRAPAT